MTRIRLGPILAFSAILVAMPRTLVAASHAAGLQVPSGPDWVAVVYVSAVAWAALEALTLARLSLAFTQTKRRGLFALIVLDLAVVATVYAPSLVADSAGLALVALIGVASALHIVWAVMQTMTYMLIVVSGFAADAATGDSEDQRKRADRLAQALTDATRDGEDQRKRADRFAQALTDAIDAQQAASVAAAQSSVTVNVAQAASGATETGGRRSDGGQVAVADHDNTETRVLRALRSGARTSVEIARIVGVTPQAVRLTASWDMRKQVWAEGSTGETA